MRMSLFAAMILLGFAGAADGAVATTAPAELAGPAVPASQPDRIVYLIDISGSIARHFDFVKLELTRVLGELNPRQQFTVIFFGSGRIVELKIDDKSGLFPVTQATRAAAREWVRAQVPHSGGRTWPSESIRRAFELLGENPGMIVLLAGSHLSGEPEKLIAELNAKKQVVIDAIGLDCLPEDERQLQKIAAENNGRYRFVSEQELRDRPTPSQPNRADFVFTEDFENFDPARWSNIKGAKTVQIVPGGRTGGMCAQITATHGENTGGYLYKMIKPGLDTAHLRFYVKFEAEHEYIHHFVRLVGYNPPTPWPQGRAGEKPNGRDFFSTGIEPWGDWGRLPPPGVWQFYTYYAEMKRSGDGKYWGNSFKPDPPAAVVRDRWTCVEIMVKCNTPAKADGEQAVWIDGRLVGHFKGIRWRTDPKLQVSGFAIESYVTEQSARHNKVDNPRKTNRCWFDDVVLSRSYIGPARRASGP